MWTHAGAGVGEQFLKSFENLFFFKTGWICNLHATCCNLGHNLQETP
jgi:hypothetical protein